MDKPPAPDTNPASLEALFAKLGGGQIDPQTLALIQALVEAEARMNPQPTPPPSQPPVNPLEMQNQQPGLAQELRSN